MTSGPATTRRSAEGRPGITAHTSPATAVVVTGVLIIAVDTTIVVLALPEIERKLHAALPTVIWVVIGYVLVITLPATQVGALAGRAFVIDVNQTVAWRP
jgi:uncharacterized membrane protein YkvI